MIDFLKIRLLVFDFDGVLTNNQVFLNEDGKEMVSCSRSDGLAFDVLNKVNLKSIILSTETNQVVSNRAKKLKIECIHGVINKQIALKHLINNLGISWDQVMYVGNDINDYHAMSNCKYKVCPRDSHKEIKNISDVVLQSNGGDGVVREIVERVFKINMINVLYKE